MELSTFCYCQTKQVFVPICQCSTHCTGSYGMIQHLSYPSPIESLSPPLNIPLSCYDTIVTLIVHPTDCRLQYHTCISFNTVGQTLQNTRTQRSTVWWRQVDPSSLTSYCRFTAVFFFSAVSGWELALLAIDVWSVERDILLRRTIPLSRSARLLLSWSPRLKAVSNFLYFCECSISRPLANACPILWGVVRASALSTPCHLVCSTPVSEFNMLAFAPFALTVLL